MSPVNSGITFSTDATEGNSRRVSVGINIDGPFTQPILKLHFPRWVPGSYFLREPIQHMTEFVAIDDAGVELNSFRYEVDAMKIKVPQNTKSISITYKLLATELSCRSNHLDSSHIHIMPPFTWFLPTSGINLERMNQKHSISLHTPSSWSAATQYKLENSTSCKGVLTGNDGTTYLFSAPNRDELLDGIIEANENENICWKVDGRNHILKLWDSGGHPIDIEMLEKFKLDMNKVIKEHHALFGIPPWDNYVTVIQLTEKSRGGLEHLNSQTSMLPRQCLMPNHTDEYLDLVSLFSHEYLHQWNVKRLRPRNFLDFDLQREAHTELLWWFEGCTSWLGDMICVRSGAWSEQDWRKDWMRKMKRTTTRNGMQFESLSESSHDAWIHLYRGHSFSRETQISYYNEGELAIFCLDAELQRRSNGNTGICDLMVELCKRHAIEYDSAVQLGVNYGDIRKALTSIDGGSRLGTMLDSLMKNRQLPDVEKACKYFSLKLVSDVKKKEQQSVLENAWLGVSTKDSAGKIIVTTHQTGSPVRELLMPGDEIIAINGRRTDSNNKLNSSLKGQNEKMASILYSHEGVIQSADIKMISKIQHKVKLEGNGNQKWRDYIATRQG